MFTRYVLPAIALIGAVFAVLFVRAGNQPVPAALPVTDPAQPPFVSHVAGAGIVESSTENIAVGTQVPGVVVEVYKKVGEHAKAGEPLFKIDSRDLEAELRVRQAGLESARANEIAQEAAVADANIQWEKAQKMGDSGAMSMEEKDRRHFASMQAQAKLTQAKADIGTAQAMLDATGIDIQRRIICSPVDGAVLQCKIHPGEYALAGVLDTPLMMLGNTDVLNVRVDVDENDAWRVDMTQPAIAFVRGNRELSAPLQFVRVEPYVLPKKSLTGSSTERVDTRVLQVLYSFDPKALHVYVGQQMDVFIKARAIGPTTAPSAS